MNEEILNALICEVQNGRDLRLVMMELDIYDDFRIISSEVKRVLEGNNADPVIVKIAKAVLEGVEYIQGEINAGNIKATTGISQMRRLYMLPYADSTTYGNV